MNLNIGGASSKKTNLVETIWCQHEELETPLQEKDEQMQLSVYFGINGRTRTGHAKATCLSQSILPISHKSAPRGSLCTRPIEIKLVPNLICRKTHVVIITQLSQHENREPM